MTGTRIRPVVVAACMYMIWLVLFGSHRLTSGPEGVHQWTQFDRLALVQTYAEAGPIVRLPRTYHLVTPNGITSVDPPLVEWLAGITMLITGNDQPVVYRAWMLLLHLIAFGCLWYLTGRFHLATWARWLMVAGVLASPLYSYYALAYLPSAQAFAFFLVATAFWMKVRTQGTGSAWWILFSILAVGIRMPFILVWAFMWMILLFEGTYPFRRLVTGGSLVALAFMVQWLWKSYVTATYGTQFLSSPMPAETLSTGLRQWWDNLRFWSLEILSPTQWVLVLVTLVSPYFLWSGKGKRSIYTLSLLAGLSLILIHGLLLSAQLSAHEYYYLDVLLPMSVLMTILALERIRIRLHPAMGWGLLLFIPFWFWQAYEVAERKDQLAASQGADMARRALHDCRSCLDALGLAATDTLLTFETYTTNGGLIACGRKGYSSLSTNPIAVRSDLQRPASIVVVPRVFLLSEVYQDFPAIDQWLVRIWSNDDLVVFHKRSRPSASGFHNLMVPEGNQYRSFLLSSPGLAIPEGWTWQPNTEALTLPWRIPANQEYGPTIRLVPAGFHHLAIRAKIGSRNGDRSVSWACDVSQNGQSPDIRYGSIPMSHGDSLAWRAWETDLPTDHDGSDVTLYLWNGGGADLLLDSLELLVW